MQYKTIEQTIGNTPLVKLQRLNPNKSNTILLKLEGNNPAGSVKDRTALNMITQAEGRGEISTGDTLIEATSGNTGIALAMVAAIKGYKMILIMPENLSQERRDAMAAYGAELILVSEAAGAADTAPPDDTPAKIPSCVAKSRVVCSVATCETSIIVSTLVASNIFGKYCVGQRRMPAIFAPSSGCTPMI
jgi:cysteine synthase